jgi:hypothetical protein
MISMMKAKAMKFDFDYIHEPGHEGRDGSAILAYGRVLVLASLGAGAGAVLIGFVYFAGALALDASAWWSAL